MPEASASPLGEALRLLRSRGFKPSGHRRGTRSFDGDLPCKGGPIKVRLSITDWAFLTYPSIKVLDHLDVLPALSPHVYASGGLCYFASGAVVLDRYDPAESMAQCLDQAQLVLERIRHDPNFRHDDIQDEFLQHWSHGESSAVYPVLIGTVDRTTKSSNYWFLTIADVAHAVVADSKEEVEALAVALGAKPPTETKCPCWLFATETLPAVPHTMPANVKELFAWLQAWDRQLHQQIQLVLERETQYLKYSIATFAIHTPLGWLGFGFDLDPVHRLGAARKPKLYRQFLHTRGGTRKISRLAITEFGPDFVHSRNLTFPDLKDKKITVVGCGAIGSHIAPGLIRLGAGTDKGRLDLVDHDDMKPENLGRHVLGYPGLFKHKADALADELKRQFPFSKVRARVRSAQGLPDLFDADLVIDATGEEAVSEMINAMRLERGTDTPVLHVRIRGNGECVQTFWAQGRQLGCFRCLLQADHKNYRQERFPVLKEQPKRKQLGCNGFTPYAVSAPMAAAALCMEAVVDWLQSGRPSPRFRTSATANANVYGVKNQDVSRLAVCPACGPRDAQRTAVPS
jgi:molybdopterin/thiamine biosynthesis adenylyltransferase